MKESQAPRIGTRSTDAGLLIALAGVLPELRGGLTPAAADALVAVLMRELATDAAAVIAADTVLAYQGIGSEHHLAGRPYRKLLAGRALGSGRTVVARGSRAVGCAVQSCRLTSGVAAPIQSGGEVAGVLVLLRADKRPLSGSVRRGAEAVARFVGRYLDHLANEDGRVRLEHEVARAARYGKPLAVAVFTSGELPSQKLERSLRAHVRAADILTRLDAQRVAVIQPDTGLDSARRATDRLLGSIGDDLRGLVRAGVGAYPAMAQDPEGLIRSASPT